ncbi:hypothetical protein PI124_g12208 [Phytophthora idaei]|nr:hypothetical protein PI124_g12208 [Phytophthora idaei]
MLLLPEDALDYLPASLVGPEYAAIVDDSEEDRVGFLFVTVDGQDNGDAHDSVEDAQVFVPRIRANHCHVWEGEQAMGAPGRFLRRPVFAMRCHWRSRFICGGAKPPAILAQTSRCPQTISSGYFTVSMWQNKIEKALTWV